MRVLHVVVGISRASGGPARSAQGLVAGLSSAGVEAWFMTLHHGETPWVNGINHFINGEPFEDAVIEVKPEIVHLHGIWSLELHRCAIICRRWNIAYVISPRGMLEPWSLQQKWLKKRIARWLYQDRDLKCAAALHATAESEAEQFKQLGFKNPLIVSPNGVNVPKNFNHVERVERAERRVLFVSRMHPKKGVLELVEAFKKVVSGEVGGLRSWKVELVYTVNGDFEREYEAKIKARVKELGLQDQFVFTGALNDDEKWNAYARADLFALPTYSENFGIVVAEALWAGVPVITTKGTPWKELEENKCGWWVDLGPGTLSETLKTVMAMSASELIEMGARGHKLIEDKYTWNAVVKNLIDSYRHILA